MPPHRYLHLVRRDDGEKGTAVGHLMKSQTLFAAAVVKSRLERGESPEGGLPETAARMAVLPTAAT